MSATFFNYVENVSICNIRRKHLDLCCAEARAGGILSRRRKKARYKRASRRKNGGPRVCCSLVGVPVIGKKHAIVAKHA